MIGTITRLEMSKGCHWLTVVDAEGKEYHCCTGDSYVLMLLTYSTTVEEIFGKQLDVTIDDESGTIRFARSVEGYDAHDILDVIESRTHFLTPSNSYAKGEGYHIVRSFNERQPKRSKPRTKLLRSLWTLKESITYFVVDHGPFETATAVWLGPVPFDLDTLQSDDAVVTTVAHMRQLGSIARGDNPGRIVGIEPPRLVQSTPRLLEHTGSS